MDITEKVRERIAAAVAIANTDPEGKKLARKMADGKLVVRIGDRPEIAILARDGVLSVTRDSSHPRAVCAFSDAESAWALLTGSMSPFSATVHRQLDQQGLSPMNETFEKIWQLAEDRIGKGKRG